MNDVRTRREIQQKLRDRRRAVASDVRTVLERVLGPPTTFRHPVLKGPRAGVPAWSIAAGAALGALFLRRPLWPLELVGKGIGLAAPLIVPLAASRLAKRGGEEDSSRPGKG